MFSNAFQSGFVSIFYSIGSNPLSLWDKAVKNGHIRRVIDEEVKSLVLEVSGTNVATTYITCPIKPKAALGIRLPFLVMIVKNLKKYFTFEIQILDDKDMRRRFRVSNFQSTTKVRPFCTTMPIGLSPGWNQIQFNLADFTRRAYGTVYLETIRVQIHANVRIRRIYFSDRLYTEEELPSEYRLFLPLRSEKPTRATTKRSKEKVPQKAPPIKAEEEEKKVEAVEKEIPSGAPPTPADALTEAPPIEEPPPDEPVSEKATIGEPVEMPEEQPPQEQEVEKPESAAPIQEGEEAPVTEGFENVEAEEALEFQEEEELPEDETDAPPPSET